MSSDTEIAGVIENQIGKLASKQVKERLRFWADYFVDYPYIDSPLGEGANKPRLRFDGFDCMTLVETCLALALSESSRDVLPYLEKIRYREGIADFYHRNHFVSVDWLPNNRWLIEPRDDLADSFIEMTIDRAAFYKDKGHPLTEGSPLPHSQHVRSRYISTPKFREIAISNLDTTIIMFVGSLDWLVVSHMGFLFRRETSIELCHASSTAGKVVRLPLLEYFADNSGLKGAIVADMAA